MFSALRISWSTIDFSADIMVPYIFRFSLTVDILQLLNYSTIMLNNKKNGLRDKRLKSDLLTLTLKIVFYKLLSIKEVLRGIFWKFLMCYKDLNSFFPTSNVVSLLSLISAKDPLHHLYLCFVEFVWYNYNLTIGSCGSVWLLSRGCAGCWMRQDGRWVSRCHDSYVWLERLWAMQPQPVWWRIHLLTISLLSCTFDWNTCRWRSVNVWNTERKMSIQRRRKNN